MTRRAHIICNPTARKGAAAAQLSTVEGVLRGHGWQLETTTTSSSVHAEQVAARADPDVVLVALGGDGLVGRVAQGALTSGAVLAPLPAGRGHDFVRALGGHSDVIEAARALPFADERLVDVGFVGSTAFLGVATVGYDSLANQHANAAPDVIPSPLVYVYGAALALLQTRPKRIVVDVDGDDLSFDGWNVAVGNSGRYGAGMKATPGARLDDGMLDVTVVAGLPRYRYPLLLPKLFAGTHVDGVRVRSYRGTSVTISAPAGMPVYADGDEVGVTPVSLSVRPDALRVLCARA